MRHLTKEIDALARDSASRHNLFRLPSVEHYTPDVVSRWIRRYWSNLEAVHLNGEGDSDWGWENLLHCIYMDLSVAISHLPEKERLAVQELCAGTPQYKTPTNQSECVAAHLHMSNKALRETLNRAYVLISNELEKKNVD